MFELTLNNKRRKNIRHYMYIAQSWLHRSEGSIVSNKHKIKCTEIYFAQAENFSFSLCCLGYRKNKHTQTLILSSLTLHPSIINPPPQPLSAPCIIPICQPATTCITCSELTGSLVLPRYPREPDLNPLLPVNHQLKSDQGSPKEVPRVMIARGACLTSWRPVKELSG